jgi:hypothetical protein
MTASVWLLTCPDTSESFTAFKSGLMVTSVCGELPQTRILDKWL